MKEELFKRAEDIMYQIDRLEREISTWNAEQIPNIKSVSRIVMDCRLKDGSETKISLPGSSVQNAVELVKNQKTLLELRISDLKKEFDNL